MGERDGDGRVEVPVSHMEQYARIRGAGARRRDHRERVGDSGAVRAGRRNPAFQVASEPVGAL
ncbi:hypothetical protein GCM10009834_50400 [Streptomonospora arabica]